MFDLPEGLTCREDFISADEERELLREVEALDFRAVVMRGQAARRTVRRFGPDYENERGELVPADPLPDALGWHRDAPMFGSRIAGVSLHSPCRIRFQRTVGGVRSTAAIELAPRSAYLLTGKARWSWQHSIPATGARRYSITFPDAQARVSRRSPFR